MFKAALARVEGSVAPMAGQPAIAWHRTREKAREAYRERLAALRAEGWQRVG